MTRDNNYTIELKFDVKNHTRILYNGQVPYYGTNSFTDDFTIYQDKIIIEAKRSAVIHLESIFHNHFSSLYNQILKALVFYYASSREFYKITSINISRARSQKKKETKSFEDNQFNQVLDNSFKLNYRLNPARLTELLSETDKGQTTLIAISYLLISNTSQSESDRFEKLWKAFNKLFTYITGEKKDFECLRLLRQFVLNNPTIMTLSSLKVKQLTKRKLRNALRWREMLLDNYDTATKTESFRDFVLRYSDKRIMEIILETKYGYREKFLKDQGYFVTVENHIKNAIAAKTKNDCELVCLLTGKYMYFVRNKAFHGEKVDSRFRLSVNKEDNEYKFLNSILEPYLVDLINANDKY